MSKYYGESERLLSKVFSLANELPDVAIIFLDEVIVAIKLYVGFQIFSEVLFYPCIMLLLFNPSLITCSYIMFS